jgi:protoporphyrinogen/coproporphyrinogen III oxidase
VEQVDQGCRQVLLKADAPPPKVLGVKVWPTAIPQYELGHLALMKELERAEAKLPGLYVCGNYRTGVAFPDCVTFGYEQAKVVRDYLNQQHEPSSSGTRTSPSVPSVVVPTTSQQETTAKQEKSLIF